MATGTVASSVQQFLGMLCLVLLWTSVARPAAALYTPTCLGPCSAVPNCNDACVTKGFPKGGVCLGFTKTDLACCCTS
ncbi:Uncharacterized protein TCM_003072 [Theobroma cacao]|uniref:Uncharacterized protein n=1 Tax=Theobroma cacao TaxID=3641 RepID=A0A061DMT7_THECC|nr:Uncharacterized protein TCM_003072 [Theobroma cacao]